MKLKEYCAPNLLHQTSRAKSIGSTTHAQNTDLCKTILEKKCNSSKNENVLHVPCRHIHTPQSAKVHSQDKKKKKNMENSFDRPSTNLRKEEDRNTLGLAK